MKNQKFQEMSNEALRKRKKTTEFVTGMLIGMLTVLLAMALYVCFTQSLSVGFPLLTVGVSLSTIVFINFADVRAVKKELQARELVE